MSNSIIATKEGAVIFTGMKSYNVSIDHPNYENIMTAAKNGEWLSIPTLVDMVATVNAAVLETGNRNLVLAGDKVMYKHIALPDDLAAYIVNMIRDKFELTPMIKFMDKLLANPDHRIFQQLFGFLSYGKNPINKEGNIISYKRVRHDYTSVHDSKTDHSIGTTVTLPREKCNNNPEQTCSTGLHFCSRDYLANFSGDRIIVLEISPTDVVSIPVDYNNTKGRACKYTVIGELTADEMEKVKTEDVLKIATVETKYDAPKVDNGGIVSEVTDVVKYLAGYKAGRAKETHTETDTSFCIGYKDGRGKKKRKYTEDDVSAQLIQELYNAGYADGRGKASQSSTDASYLDGYKDGRGKKKRKHPAPVVIAPAPKVPTYTDKELYLMGFVDGKNKKPVVLSDANVALADAYKAGYKDGKNKKKRKYL